MSSKMWNELKGINKMNEELTEEMKEYIETLKIAFKYNPSKELEIKISEHQSLIDCMIKGDN